jgi:hypothetical protein
MQTDYQAAMAEQQAREEQRYQQTRDPFEYGRQVAQRRYSEIMSGLDQQRAQTAQSYSDLYSAARQQAVRGQAAGGPTLSGGMGQQQRDYVSAIEMQELGKIGTAREGAMRDLYTQAQSAMSNAELEGQQATQMQLQNQQTQLELINQRNAIINNDSLTEEQKREQLDVLGFGDEENIDAINEGTAFGDIVKTIGVGVGVKAGAWGIGALVGKLGAATLSASLVSNPVGWGIAAAAAVVYGVDKLSERFGWFGGDLIGFI